MITPTLVRPDVMAGTGFLGKHADEIYYLERDDLYLTGTSEVALAGYHATHGILKHTMPSDTWQIIFSVIGAIAVGVTAFVRVTAMAAPGPSGRGLARA